MSINGSSIVEAPPDLTDVEKMMIREAGTTVYYSKGHNIFSAGEVSDRVYLIESGYVKIYRLSADGKRVTVGSMRSPGELMGLAETLLGTERTCFAGAITNSSLVVLHKNKFEELLARQPFLGIKISKLLAARMRDAEGIIHEMVAWQTPGRLALMLLKMGERAGVRTKNGIQINLPLTHEEIASMIGASRQTVTSLLNTFKREKSIVLENRNIIIADPDKLASWLT
ncbi:CRP-like cAMP-binding protein [Desulfohalotomaculum tongense]|uniref:Crp/Fnr family transcriptional regulator n=1 Tax=Desulforadius tongensis TaxID=1216062 RepID=UPI00195721D9|nr:Crp/Fnr family transcriptional regulator [Desulforadius tongensis]MBM7855100.1 CRP-like cAMP-binding protein [Desulforadius tongensis]